MPQRADHPGKAWCFQHEMPPNDCFELHNPKAKEVKGALTPEQHNAEIVRRHIAKQRENFERNMRKQETVFSKHLKKG